MKANLFFIIIAIGFMIFFFFFLRGLEKNYDLPAVNSEYKKE